MDTTFQYLRTHASELGSRDVYKRQGWSHVTVRRLSDEISYSQPVLYAHFGSREGILDAVAIEGFQEIGLALEKARCV